MKIRGSHKLILLSLYVLIFVATQWPLAWRTLQRIPSTVALATKHWQYMLQYPAFQKMLVTVPLDWGKAFIIVGLLPIGALFILKRRVFARNLIYFGCFYLFLNTVYLFITTYPDMVGWDMHRHLPKVQCGYLLAKDYLGLNINRDLEFAYIQSILISVLVTLLPIYFLSRTDFQELFRNKALPDSS